MRFDFRVKYDPDMFGEIHSLISYIRSVVPYIHSLRATNLTYNIKKTFITIWRFTKHQNHLILWKEQFIKNELSHLY